MPRSRITVSDLSIQVHLGCTPSEREKLQEVRLSFELSTPSLPKACLTDKLSDTTVCYGALSDSLRELGQSQGFQTIERLAHLCHEKIKSQVPTQTRILLSVRKVAPPVNSLLGGVTFTLSEEEEGARPHE